MKLSYIEKVVNLRGKIYTIIIPEGISGFINRPVVFDADREGLETILMSALMMLRNKNIIVYYPLWNNALPQYYLRDTFTAERNNKDVVFVHHSVQMPISDWKEIRNRLKKTKGLKHTIGMDTEKECLKYKKEYEKYYNSKMYYKDIDVFRFTDRFDTYFFVGGKYSLVVLSIQLKEMLDLPLEDRFSANWLCDWIQLEGEADEISLELGYYDASIEEMHHIAEMNHRL